MSGDIFLVDVLRHIFQYTGKSCERDVFVSRLQLEHVPRDGVFGDEQVAVIPWPPPEIILSELQLKPWQVKFEVAVRSRSIFQLSFAFSLQLPIF